MRLKPLLALVLFAASPFAPAGSPDGPGDVLGIPQRPGLLESLRKLDLDVLAAWEGVLYVHADKAARARLDAAGIAAWKPQGLFPAPLRGATEAMGGPNGAYHSYRELERELAGLAARFPGLARLSTLGWSLENRRIMALKISDHAALEEDEAGLLLVGCHHAREWISVEVPLLIAKRLLESYDSNPEIREIVDGSEIWIVPLLNPDGLEYSIGTYRYWRKNRRDNGDGSFGVDLNRNYGLAWGLDEAGSSSNPDSGVFRGRAAFSEPETAALRDLVLRRGFDAVVSYHSFGQLILYPWAYTSQPAPSKPDLDDLGRHLAELMRAVGGRDYTVGQSGEDLYLSNGDAADWAHAETGGPAYTVELPPVDLVHGGFINAEADIDGIFRENLPAVLELALRAVRAHREAAEGSKRRSDERAPDRPRPRIR